MPLQKCDPRMDLMHKIMNFIKVKYMTLGITLTSRGVPLATVLEESTMRMAMSCCAPVVRIERFLVLRLGSRPIVVIGCSGSQRFVTETLFLMIHIGFATSILY